MLQLGLVGFFFVAPVEPTISQDQLVQMMRNITLQLMPTPLYDKVENWGKQRPSPNGITWVKKGLVRVPEVQMKLKNDGIWRKMRADAIEPNQTLKVGLENIVVPEEGRMTFQVHVQLPVRGYLEQQVWESGVRLYSGETRLRVLAGVMVQCEMTSKLEKPEGSFFPDLVIRVKAVQANVGYQNLVVEHVLGVDGKLAEELGNTAIKIVKDIKPGLEGELLQKGNAAIVKMVDTKEIRLGFNQLMKSKKK